MCVCVCVCVCVIWSNILSQKFYVTRGRNQAFV